MLDWLGDLLDLKAPQPRRERRVRNVPFVGADVLEGTEEYQDLGGRDEVAQKAALTLPSAYGAMSNVAKLCAQHDPHVGRQTGPDDKPKPERNHVFERAMWRPNKWMSNTFVWWFTYMAIQARGMAFLFMEDGGDRGGDVKEIWPMPPWQVKPIPSRDSRTFVTGFNYWPETGAEPIFLPAENVCWIRQPDLMNLYGGNAAIAPGQQALYTAKNQWAFRGNFYGKRRGRPEVLIGAKDNMSPTVFNRLKRELLTQFGVQDRGTLIHRMGDLDVKILGMSADDMQLLQFQDHDAKVLQSLYGWNSALGQATSYAMADVAWEIVAQIGAWPLMKLLSGDLSSQVLRPRYGDEFCVYYDDIRPKRRDADRADYQVYGQDMTINQLRKLRGDEPITSGPMGEVCETVPTRLLTFHFQQQASAAPTAEASAPAAPEQPDDVKADLVKWERKALRTVNESGSGAAAFESDHIPANLHAAIAGYLTYAITPDEVKEAFKCALQPAQLLP